MNRKGFKNMLLAGVALAAIGFCATAADAHWWGAAPAGCCGDGWPQSCDCGSWGGCGACGGGGWYGVHHGAHHGCLSCGCGYGFYSGCGGCSSCYNNWSSNCGGCNSCSGGWSGYGSWSPMGCSTCGGVMTGSGTFSGTLSGTGTIAPAPTGPSIPTPAAAPAAGTAPAAPTPPLSTPAAPALPSTSTPATPEGGLPIPGGHGASLEETGADGCLLTVWVPYEAKVSINGMATKSVGSRRQFVSYGLKPGFTYTYEVVAKLVREGKELTESKTISLTAGGRDGVAFGFNVIPEGQTASN